MTLFILSLHVAWCIPISFCSREYMGQKIFEKFQKGCLVHDHLLYLSEMKEAFMSLFLAWSIQSSFCSWGHMVWKKMWVEEFQDGCLMLDPLWNLNGMISAFLCNLSACCLQSYFCSRGYMVWEMLVNNSKMAVSARQSLICKWNNYSYFWVSMLLEAFHQVSVQEDVWFQRCWLKNSKMAVK